MQCANPSVCHLHPAQICPQRQPPDRQLMVWSSYWRANFSTHWKCLVGKFNKLKCRSCITNLHLSHWRISGYGKCAYTGQIIFLWLIIFFWISCLKSFLVVLKVILMLRCIPIILVFHSTSYLLRLLMFLKNPKEKLCVSLKKIWKQEHTF